MSGASTIAAWARDVERFEREAPGDAIAVVDDAITARLHADTGGDGALSHGRKLGRASTEITKRPGEAQVSAGGSQAVWGILQGGTVAHTIVARPGRPMATPYGPRQRVRVGASRARHTFTEGADKGITAAQRDLEQAWTKVGA
jgi:hypothetical protein